MEPRPDPHHTSEAMVMKLGAGAGLVAWTILTVFTTVVATLTANLVLKLVN